MIVNILDETKSKESSDTVTLNFVTRGFVEHMAVIGRPFGRYITTHQLQLDGTVYHVLDFPEIDPDGAPWNGFFVSVVKKGHEEAEIKRVVESNRDTWMRYRRTPGLEGRNVMKHDK